MPLYDFCCGQCGTEFCELRPMARSGESCSCPNCDSDAPRMISAPRLAVLTASQRNAHQVNERSAHEPRAVTGNKEKQHVCGSECSHAHAKSAEESKPALRQSKSTSRPWMIGH